MKPVDRYKTTMKTSLTAALLAVPVAALLSACSEKPAAERPRAVRTAEVRYDKSQENNRYVGTVQSRHEVNEAFRVGGKIVQRKVDVGQKVREGDVLACSMTPITARPRKRRGISTWRPPRRRGRPTRIGKT